MRIMQPTNRLRWNKLPNGASRIEQLWTERPIGPGDGVSDPRSEWRPLQLVKIGWDNDRYDEPLEYDGT